MQFKWDLFRFLCYNFLYAIKRLLSCRANIYAKQQLDELTHHRHNSNRCRSSDGHSCLNEFHFFTHVTIDGRYFFLFFRNSRHSKYTYMCVFCFNEYECHLVSKRIFCVEKRKKKKKNDDRIRWSNNGIDP